MAETPQLLNAAMLRWLDELSHQGIFTTDANLVIRSWNLWLQRNTNRQAADVVGHYPGLPLGDVGVDHDQAVIAADERDVDVHPVVVGDPDTRRHLKEVGHAGHCRQG